MADLFSRSMRFALNNTGVFSGQASWRLPRRRAGLAVAIWLCALASGLGCRAAKRLAKDEGARGAARPDLTPPR
ncbi:MAG TPA: hypothetical protein VG319_07840, partial [Polyangia bacterium]|nr:hypothetical protein [Polyangia bacterium]